MISVVMRFCSAHLKTSPAAPRRVTDELQYVVVSTAAGTGTMGESESGDRRRRRSQPRH